MILREPFLPPGWYPRDPEKIRAFLAPFVEAGAVKRAAAAVGPHAGWYYSGAIAARSVASLDPEAETLVIIGGHLPRGMPVLAAGEEGVKTPLGPMMMDGELREALRGRLRWREDHYGDNTVEVFLPMARYFFPRARLLWLRFPGELRSLEAGELLAECAASLGRRIAVLGSTDLTHYGPNYDFSPRGSGRAALDWVREVNDRGFIDAVLSGKAGAVLERADRDFSSCSPGAVLGAMGYAAAVGAGSAELLAYSAGLPEEEIPDSFVGYGAFAFFKSPKVSVT
jgi:AmmeMemoRadiSam system protein B